MPVGDGPTIGAARAAGSSPRSAPLVVPMHYRTPRIGFLETEEEFAGLMPRVERVEHTSFDTADLPEADGTLVVIPAAP